MSTLLDRFSLAGEPIGDDAEIFFSFDDVPLDTPGEDGDQTVLQETQEAKKPLILPGDKEFVDHPVALRALAGVVPLAAIPVKKNAVVPAIKRELKYKAGGAYMKGPDVEAVDRVLWRAEIYKKVPGKPFRRNYGPGMRDQVKKLQHKLRLKVDGVYGEATHRAAAKYFDARAIWLYQQYHAVAPKPLPADMIVAAAMIGYNYRSRIHYTQGGSRMYLTRNKVKPQDVSKHNVIWEDCSSFATWLYWQAGLPDPNGFGYNGFGYTGTLVNHGQRVWTNEAPIGALTFYGGGYPYSHVVIRISRAGRVISNGNEAGPSIYESTYYRPDVRQTHKYF